MEPSKARKKVASRIQHMVNSAVIKKRRYLEDEQLLKSEQLDVFDEIFNANVRDTEIKELSSHFARILCNDHPCHIAIWGKTGTGKTLTIMYFLKLLSEICRTKKIPIRHVHLDLSNPRPCFRALNDLACLLNASKRYEIDYIAGAGSDRLPQRQKLYRYNQIPAIVLGPKDLEEPNWDEQLYEKLQQAYRQAFDPRRYMSAPAEK